MAKTRGAKKQTGKKPSTVKRRKDVTPTPPVNRFFMLPREIRDEIYRQFGLPMHLRLDFRERLQKRSHRVPVLKGWLPSAPLFQICHQIRSEALDFICRWNIFVFDIPCQTPFSALTPFLQRIRFLELVWIRNAYELRDHSEQLARELINQASMSSLRQLTITPVCRSTLGSPSPRELCEDTSLRLFLKEITTLQSLELVRLAGTNIGAEIIARELSLNTLQRIEVVCFGFNGFHSRCVGLNASAREFATASPDIGSESLNAEKRKPTCSGPEPLFSMIASGRDYLRNDTYDFLGFRFRRDPMLLYHRIRAFNESKEACEILAPVSDSQCGN